MRKAVLVGIAVTALTLTGCAGGEAAPPASGQGGSKEADGGAQKGSAKPDKVVFKVSGSGKPNITYMTDSGSHSGNDAKNDLGMGYANLPWKGSLPLEKGALYYAVNAQLGKGGGKITCKVLIGGEVVANGSASGAFQICSAQANANMPGGFGN